MSYECVRCERYYRTSNAYHQHLRDSKHHHECPTCDFDGASWDELLNHCREEECHEVCQGCDGGLGEYWDTDEYWEHVEEYNVCTKCERHFMAPSNLRNHEITHREATLECLRCYRNFKTYSGMIVHLESGACLSKLNVIDINMSAAKCKKWQFFIDADFHDDMLSGVDLAENYDYFQPYKCPTCAITTSKLSGLFQHIESTACSQSINEGPIGQLRNYLNARHG